MKPTTDHPEAVADHLFAYGTLHPGLAPPEIRAVVDQLTLVGPGSAAGRLYDLGAYPGATFDDPPSGDVVHGRAYRLPTDAAATWAALDAYEGTPTLYVRRRLTVTSDGGGDLPCWAYQYNGDLTGRRRILSGRYVPNAPLA